MKQKTLPFHEFTGVQAYDWTPVALQTVPDLLRNLPPHKLQAIIASGSFIKGNTGFYSGNVSGVHIGSLEVYRKDAKDYPNIINKDVYLIWSGILPDQFVIQGPSKDEEHHIKEIPKRYSGIKTIK